MTSSDPMDMINTTIMDTEGNKYKWRMLNWNTKIKISDQVSVANLKHAKHTIKMNFTNGDLSARCLG